MDKARYAPFSAMTDKQCGQTDKAGLKLDSVVVLWRSMQ